MIFNVIIYIRECIMRMLNDVIMNLLKWKILYAICRHTQKYLFIEFFSIVRSLHGMKRKPFSVFRQKRVFSFFLFIFLCGFSSRAHFNDSPKSASLQHFSLVAVHFYIWKIFYSQMIYWTKMRFNFSMCNV